MPPTATAVFSHERWFAGIPFDSVEESLHSVAATVAGFAFALGVRLLQRRREGGPGMRLDAATIGAAVVLPLRMALPPDLDGVLQRVVSLVAFVWYGREAVTARLTGGFMATAGGGVDWLPEFARAGLITRYIVTVMPVLLGDGVRLLGERGATGRLRLASGERIGDATQLVHLA